VAVKQKGKGDKMARQQSRRKMRTAKERQGERRRPAAGLGSVTLEEGRTRGFVPRGFGSSRFVPGGFIKISAERHCILKFYRERKEQKSAEKCRKVHFFFRRRRGHDAVILDKK
jgi:hypothetical protein